MDGEDDKDSCFQLDPNGQAEIEIPFNTALKLTDVLIIGQATCEATVSETSFPTQPETCGGGTENPDFFRNSNLQLMNTATSWEYLWDET